MIELPEAFTLANQLNQTVTNCKVASVTAGNSPHKFAWLSGDSAYYSERLVNRCLETAVNSGGVVELRFEDGQCLWFSDGINLRLLERDEQRPQKHQLLIELKDGRALCASVAMYGGMYCSHEKEMDNPYIVCGRVKPSPLSAEFDKAYFSQLLAGNEKLSAKAFLATEQRIPGLGNGTLQDILFCANVHPKRKMGDLSDAQFDTLFDCIKSVLYEMTQKGGRDTETDLFGRMGGYVTKLSRNTSAKPCPICKEPIVKMAYMGGSVYFCPHCQIL